MAVGFVSVGIAVVVGTLIGSVAAYYGGRVDELTMRVVDLMLNFPRFFLLLTLIDFLRPSIFVIMAVVVALLTVLVPIIAGLIAPFIGTSALTAAFSGISAGVWWFLDFCQLAFGVPLLISAWVTRFIIRRIPFVG